MPSADSSGNNSFATSRVTRIPDGEVELFFGGIVTIRVKGGFESAKRFCERTHLFTLAESLGGVESLVNHPAVMTHASVPVERRAVLGIHDDLVRLSVGVESVEDLRHDLDRALTQ